jgi:hypothetical protein
MDHTTITLINAIELLLIAGHLPAPSNHPDRWTFQEDSEIHIVLTEALAEARIATGLDNPAPPSPHTKHPIAHTQ